MSALVHFTIPFRGFKSGMYLFDFQLDSSFFKHFEGSPIEDGAFNLQLSFDKRPDMFVLDFDIEGWMAAECDRCLENIQLPIKDQQQLIIKFSEEPSDDPLVENISPESQNLNVAKYIYEYVCLAMPITKVYDCKSEEQPPCNDEMLKYMEAKKEKEEKADNPIWSALKKFNKKK